MQEKKPHEQVVQQLTVNSSLKKCQKPETTRRLVKSFNENTPKTTSITTGGTT